MQTEKLLFKLRCCPTQPWHCGWSGRACLHAQGRLEAEQTSRAQICLLPKSHLLNHGRASSRPCPRALSGCEGHRGHLVRQWKASSFWRGGWKGRLGSKNFLSPLRYTRTVLLTLLHPDRQLRVFLGWNGLYPVLLAKLQPWSRQEQDLLVKPTVPAIYWAQNILSKAAEVHRKTHRLMQNP